MVFGHLTGIFLALLGYITGYFVICCTLLPGLKWRIPKKNKTVYDVDSKKENVTKMRSSNNNNTLNDKSCMAQAHCRQTIGTNYKTKPCSNQQILRE